MLTAAAAAETELARRQSRRPAALTVDERAQVLALGDDLPGVWDAPITDRDRKQLLRILLEEVVITITRDLGTGRADLLIRWKGGAISELTVPIRRAPPKIRTDEDTIDLLYRLAVHHPDAVIAGILNRQHRATARGLSFTASRIQGLRHHWDIPCHQPNTDTAEGNLLTVADAAKTLGTAPSTLHRWLGDGFSPASRTPPAPTADDAPARSRTGCTRPGRHRMVPTCTTPPIDGVGAQLCPSGIATITPWAFTVASHRKESVPARSSRLAPARRCAPQPSPDPPGSSWRAD
jgi:hypothetical protein